MATTPPISIRDFIEQRTLLLDALSESLAAASTCLVGFDLDGLESRIAQQQKLCLELCQLDIQLETVQHRIAQAAGESLSNACELPEAVSRLREAQSRVKQLNDQHQALLLRSRRTVNALMRSYQTFAAGLYLDPTKPPRIAGEPA